MPRQYKINTQAQAAACTKPGSHSCGDTLYLRVAPGGSRSWVQRITTGDKPKMDATGNVVRDARGLPVILQTQTFRGLGSFKLFSLKEARDMARENLRALAQGNDPWEAKSRAKLERLSAQVHAPATPTFRALEREIFRDITAAVEAGKKAESGARDWRGRMDAYCLPLIGDKPVSTITKADVIAVLKPIWATKADASRKLRQNMGRVFKLAMAKDYIGTNPAGEVIDAALPRDIKPEAENHAALDWREVPAFFASLAETKVSTEAKCAMKLITLTACRRNEILGAEWSEIDRKAGVWTIPAERMKVKKADHRIPLSDAMLAVLKECETTRKGKYLFPARLVRSGKGERPMSKTPIVKLMEAAGIAGEATVHGFRSSFRDWCADNGQPRELAEAALAHVVGGVEGAYQRSDMLERRGELMQTWGAFCTTG